MRRSWPESRSNNSSVVTKPAMPAPITTTSYFRSAIRVQGTVCAVLGLPTTVNACLFDLDGVLTQTQKVHAAAWKQMFDQYLAEHGGGTFEEADYDQYVDGKPRNDGVRSFLESRDIHLPQEGIGELGNRKNQLVLEMIHTQGVEPYQGSVRYVRAARDAGLRRAVVSSSTNCHDVLVAAGIVEEFEAVIDGHVAEREQLKGKPAPDTFLAGARALGVQPSQAAVFEDALAGVEAGRAGSFGIVIGVDRAGQADALREHGADVVVEDLAELVDQG
jgi:beta-phosphoglucomutase family hydrolase